MPPFLEDELDSTTLLTMIVPRSVWSVVEFTECSRSGSFFPIVKLSLLPGKIAGVFRYAPLPSLSVCDVRMWGIDWSLIHVIVCPGLTVTLAGWKPVVPVIRISITGRTADGAVDDDTGTAVPPVPLTWAFMACQPPASVKPMSEKATMPTMAPGRRDAGRTETRYGFPAAADGAGAGTALVRAAMSSSPVECQWGCRSVIEEGFLRR